MKWFHTRKMTCIIILISTSDLHVHVHVHVYITPVLYVQVYMYTMYMYCRSTLRNSAVYQEIASKCFMCGTLTKDSHLLKIHTHEGSLTHRPSSQGWDPKSPIHLCLCVCTVRVWCIGSGFPFFSSSTTNLALYIVCYTHVNMYMY